MVPDAGLHGTMVAVMVCAGVSVVGVTVVVRLGKCGRRNQHQQQGCEDNLLHGLRVAPVELPRQHAHWVESAGANQERKQRWRSVERRQEISPSSESWKGIEGPKTEAATSLDLKSLVVLRRLGLVLIYWPTAGADVNSTLTLGRSMPTRTVVPVLLSV